ncbi:GDP/GTP exchange factor for ARF [Tieghemiomyces parasiticus]|uniref:GDP/GTP exchange factor for ARF n=1 Tax=Tieghemiomyces parasiticus TaxID=78921 RepID=A0A9W8ALX1_9FUNG|nr:GDP/GTP exchange factor for ARF [Tieghemiomyces parasiticus]
MTLPASALCNEYYALLNCLRRSNAWRRTSIGLPFGKLGIQLGMSSFGPASERQAGPAVSSTATSDTAPSADCRSAQLHSCYARLCTDTTAASDPTAYRRAALEGTTVVLDTPTARAHFLDAIEVLLDVLRLSPAGLEGHLLDLLFPLLVVLRSGTTGNITLAALQSLQRIVVSGALERAARIPLGSDKGQLTLASTDLPVALDYYRTLAAVAAAAAQCRFDSTDAATDEQVLSRVLELMDAVLARPGGAFLGDDLICTMLETTISLACQGKVNPLLRTAAESTLLGWVDRLFGDLQAQLVRAEATSAPAGESEKPGATTRQRSDSIPVLRINPTESAGHREPVPAPEPSHAADGPAVAPPSDDPHAAYALLRAERHGVPCLLELLRVLAALADPHDVQYTDGMRLIALHALDAAFATAGPALATHPAFREVITQALLKHLYRIVEADFLPLMPAALRLVTDLLPGLRTVSPTYFHTFFALLLARLHLPPLANATAADPITATGADTAALAAWLPEATTEGADGLPTFRYALLTAHLPPALLQRVRPLPTPQHRLLLARAVDQLADNDGAAGELWAAYDTDPYAGNLWELYIAYLCRHAVPQLERDLVGAHSSRSGESTTTPAAPPAADPARFPDVTERPLAALIPLLIAYNLPEHYTAQAGAWDVAFREEGRLCLQRLTALLSGMLTRTGGGAITRDPWAALMAGVTNGDDEPLSVDAPVPTAEERAGLAELVRARARKETLCFAVALFNDDPKQCLRFLQDRGWLPSTAASTDGEKGPADLTPEQVAIWARFLRYAPALNKACLGDYLARPQQLPVLQAYVGLFDFTGQRLDEALRQLLIEFRLPGESQQIERIVETFAAHYHAAQGTSEVATADAGFILSYAVIMLNTDQHSRQVKERMRLEDFSRNLRGVNGGADFQPEYLAAIYTAIRTREIILPEEHDRADRFDEVWAGLHPDRQPDTDKALVVAPTLPVLRPTVRDAFLFRLLYGPVLLTYSQILLKCGDDRTLQTTLEGLYLSSRLAAAYGVPGAMATLVSHLCTVAGTLEDSAQADLHDPQVVTDPHDPATSLALTELGLQLGRDYRGQIALILLLTLARQTPTLLGDSWFLVWRTVRSLVAADLVDPALVRLDAYPGLDSDVAGQPINMAASPSGLGRDGETPDSARSTLAAGLARLPADLFPASLPLVLSTTDPTAYLPDPKTEERFHEGRFAEAYETPATPAVGITGEPAEGDGSLFSTLSSYFLSSYTPVPEKSGADPVAPTAAALSSAITPPTVAGGPSSAAAGRRPASFRRAESGPLRWDASLDLLVHLTRSARTAALACRLPDLFTSLARLDPASLVPVLEGLAPHLPHTDSPTTRHPYDRGQACLYEQWLRLGLANAHRLSALWPVWAPAVAHVLDHALAFPTCLVRRTLIVLFQLAKITTTTDDDPTARDAVLNRLQTTLLYLHAPNPDADPAQSVLHHPSLVTPVVAGAWDLWQAVKTTAPDALARATGDQPGDLGPLFRVVTDQARYYVPSQPLAWQLLRAWLTAALEVPDPVLYVDLVRRAAAYLPTNCPGATAANRVSSSNQGGAGPAATSSPVFSNDRTELALAGAVFDTALRLMMRTPRAAERLEWDTARAWTTAERPLLAVLLRPCIHPHRGVRQLATARFQQALAQVSLVPTVAYDVGVVRVVWADVFDHLFFPTLQQLLSPAVMMEFDARGYEETCTRLVSLVSSFFLRHLHGPVLDALAITPTADSSAAGDSEVTTTRPFPRVWLTWLDLVVACLNRMEEWGLSKEVVVEHMKNMLLILSSLRAFDGPAMADPASPPRNPLWQATWNKIGWVLPDLKTELFPDLDDDKAEPEVEPVATKTRNTSPDIDQPEAVAPPSTAEASPSVTEDLASDKVSPVVPTAQPVSPKVAPTNTGTSTRIIVQTPALTP